MVIVLGVLGLVVSVLFFIAPSDYTSVLDPKPTDQIDSVEGAQDEIITDSKPSGVVQDPVEAYHQQVRTHVAGSRFEWIYARYRETNDIELLGSLIDVWLAGGEYEILRDELWEVAVDSLEVVRIVWAQRILKTLFTVTPLTFKSYEPLKNVVDKYEAMGQITAEEKNFWYSLVALSKWHVEDYEYYTNLANDVQWISLIESVKETQGAYTYVPEWRWLALYGVAMYEAWWYRVAQNIASLIQKEDSTFVLGYQLWSWSNLQLHQWSRAEKASQKALQYDTDTWSKYEYLLIEAISVYNEWDYARSALLFNQLERTDYNEFAVRYAFKIANETNQSLAPSLKKLSMIEMAPSDYYEVVSLLYPPFKKLSKDSLDGIEDIVQQCQSAIESSYSYICIMWKAGLLRGEWEVEKSGIILKQVTRQFPTWDARELLWEVYTLQWKETLAKEAYIQALRFAQNQDDQERLTPRIRSLVDSI